MSLSRRGIPARRIGRPLVALIVVAVSLWASGFQASAASAQSSGIEVRIETGFRGSARVGQPIPVRVALTAHQPQRVTVEVVPTQPYETETMPAPTPRYSIDISAEAQAIVDTASSPASAIRVLVKDTSGEVLESRTVTVDYSADTAVGVLTSIPLSGDNVPTDTVGSLSTAKLLRVDPSDLVRPSLLDVMGGLVVGAADLEQLQPRAIDLIRQWVYRGGSLMIDTAPSDPLPIVDLPATTPQRTPIGGGWVIFTNGQAQRGEWSAFLEPGTNLPVDNRDQWFGQDDSFDSLENRNVALVDFALIPTGTIAAILIGTALLVGPVMGVALKRAKRSHLMWVAAPLTAVLIAGGVVNVGARRLDQAHTSGNGSGWGTPWGAYGGVGLGISESLESVPLAEGAEARSASDSVSVDRRGDISMVSLGLKSNSFASLTVTNDYFSPMRVTPSATTDTDGSIVVGDLASSGLAIRTIIADGFDHSDVTNSDPQIRLPHHKLSLFARTLLVDAQRPSCINGQECAVNFPNLSRIAESRGLVYVVSATSTEISAVGRHATGVARLTMLVPVVAPPNASRDIALSSLRIDPLLPRKATPLAATTPTTQPHMGTSAPPDPALANYAVRFTSSVDISAFSCAVHTAVGNVEAWVDRRWQRLPTSAPHLSERFIDPNEVADVQMPAMRAGEPLFVRFADHDGLIAPTMVFACGDPT